jgi:hypothetical protein
MLPGEVATWAAVIKASNVVRTERFANQERDNQAAPDSLKKRPALR